MLGEVPLEDAFIFSLHVLSCFKFRTNTHRFTPWAPVGAKNMLQNVLWYSKHFVSIQNISDNLSDPEWDNSYSYPRFWAGCDGLLWAQCPGLWLVNTCHVTSILASDWSILGPMCTVWKLLCVPLLDPEHTLEQDHILFYCSSFMSVLCTRK